MSDNIQIIFGGTSQYLPREYNKALSPYTMRILITICFSCALVPTSALLGSKSQEKWYQNRNQKSLANSFNEVS